MKAKLVIKGAYYKNGNEILVPHFTGEYVMVDCDRYMKKNDLLDIYNKSYFEENKENYVVVEGEKYYYAEYSPYTVDDEWELLSDLSELHHIE
jgi:hypothetical protein